MKEYSERIKTLIEEVNNKTSAELFGIIESELNTRITAVISNKRVYGNEYYNCRIKIGSFVICSEYNVLKANYSYLLFAVNIIKEKIQLEKMTGLYKGVVNSAIYALTQKEFKGVSAVLFELKYRDGVVITSEISKKVDVTRSIIINGLKKLECAGILEMYSMGAKGTNIKILYSEIRSAIEGRTV